MSTFKDLLSKDLQHQLKNIKTLAKNAQQAEQAKQTQIAAKAEQQTSDAKLFAQAMMGVRPIKHDKIVAQKAPKTDDNAHYRRANAQGGDDVSVQLSDMQALLNPVAGEAYLSYKQATLQNRVFEQLKQGKMRWYDAVDLHGSSIEDARQAVTLLIHQATQQGETVVKIVHGKGKDAIIKTCVNGWLRQMSNVLAFVSAPANDGGNGAVLVLLKKDKTTTNANERDFY